MEVAGGLISPTVSGYDASFDPFGKKKKPAGDPAKRTPSSRRPASST